MITGDSRETAVAIGEELGILEPGRGDRAWEGADFFRDESPDAEAKRAALLAPDAGDGVFCRTAPADKQRIIKLLADAHGDVTAMTGDGVNDAPALQQASIGIAMGVWQAARTSFDDAPIAAVRLTDDPRRSRGIDAPLWNASVARRTIQDAAGASTRRTQVTGTEVAKQAADMVLMDDDFATIVAAVEEGRAIYKNMQAFVCFLLSCNFGEVATVFGATLLGVPDVPT